MTRVLLQKNSVVSLTSSWKSCRKITSLCYYYSSAPSVLEVVRQILRHHFSITIFHYWLSATPKIAKKKNSEMNLHLFLHYSCSQCRKKTATPISKKGVYTIMERQFVWPHDSLWITLHLSDIFTKQSLVMNHHHLFFTSLMNLKLTPQNSKQSKYIIKYHDMQNAIWSSVSSRLLLPTQTSLYLTSNEILYSKEPIEKELTTTMTVSWTKMRWFIVVKYCSNVFCLNYG